MSLLEKFNDLVCEAFGVDESALNDAASPDDFENWDSVTHMDLMALFEDAWDVSLDVEEITEMTTIGLMKEILRKHGVDL